MGGNPEAVVRLLNHADFLQQITVHGLKLLLSTQRIGLDANKDAMIRSFLHHKPLKITLKHHDDTQSMTVKRSDLLQQFLLDFSLRKHLIVVDGEPVFHYSMGCLSQLGINDGSAIEIRDLTPTPVQAPQDSSCSSLNKI